MVQLTRLVAIRSKQCHSRLIERGDETEDGIRADCSCEPVLKSIATRSDVIMTVAITQSVTSITMQRISLFFEAEQKIQTHKINK